MSKFFCNGKKDFCDKDICPNDCEFFDNTGGKYIDETVEEKNDGEPVSKAMP